MNIAATKIELAREILSIEDESVLKKIENILSDFYTDKQPKPKAYSMTMDELNQRIDVAEEDFKYGRYADSKDLIKKYTK
jgi:hypothetical protein